MGIAIHAMETYIMHFLEAARFLYALVLAGRKVNVLNDPGLAAILPLPPHNTKAVKCLGPETTTLLSFA